jgi:hypothetical protein
MVIIPNEPGKRPILSAKAVFKPSLHDGLVTAVAMLFACSPKSKRPPNIA